MRKLLHLLLITLGYRALWLAKKVDPGGSGKREALAEQRVAAWYADPEHVTRLYDFPLDEGSLALDVGGFEGSWAAEILLRHGCRVEVFEPVPQFAQRLRQRFEFTNKVTVHDFGLGGRDDRLRLSVSSERSSFFHEPGRGSDTVEANVRDIVSYLGEHAIEGADLLKLNIEGAEFELLERVLDADRARAFGFILVQFHDELPDAQQRADAIARRLGETHELMWRFPFVWEAWRRR